MQVLGIDPGLVHSGVACIQDGKAMWTSTITVQGDSEDTGPRYVLVRECLENLLRNTKKIDPAVIAIEQPELSIRKKRDAGSILKLYGSFAVIHAECRRLFPDAHLLGPRADRWKGTTGKTLTARIFGAKYGVKQFRSDHESDALGLADLAWDYAQHKLRQEAKEREKKKDEREGEEPPQKSRRF